MPNSDPLHEAFKRFLNDHDEASLLAAVRRHGGHEPSSDVDFPIAHRICDVQLAGSAFRVNRVFDPDDRSARLYIFPTEAPSYTTPGVPFALQGTALKRWVEDESRSLTDGPIDWSRYDESMPTAAKTR